MTSATSLVLPDTPGEQAAGPQHPGPVRIGVGGPVGRARTQLIERITGP